MKFALTMILAFLLLAFLPGAKAQSAASARFKKLEWLTGKWVRTNSKPGGSGAELWQKVSPFKLIGKGLTLKGRDTVFTELLEISIRRKDILYTVKLSDELVPVVFKLTSISTQGF